MTTTVKRPQVLLLGNGLVRAYGGVNWESGIQSINRSNKIDVSSPLFNTVPFPLKAIIATEDHIDIALKSKDAEEILFGLKDVSGLREPLFDLLKLRFDHILTTNYSYEIERVLDPDFKRLFGKFGQKNRNFGGNIKHGWNNFNIGGYRMDCYGHIPNARPNHGVFKLVYSGEWLVLVVSSFWNSPTIMELFRSLY